MEGGQTDSVIGRRTPASVSVSPATWLSRLRAAALEPSLREPLTIWLLTRALFLVLTYFGVILYGQVFSQPHPTQLHQLLPSWDRWDTVWYIDIARRGYAWHRPGVSTSPTAFFPLYPLLIRAGVALTHRSYLAVALAVSNLALLPALIYLWKLVAWERHSAAARRTVLYITVFPTALFFFAGYTESLYLLLTVASFYHLRRRDWLLAGVFGGLAAATRVTGVLLLVPLAYEYARDRNFTIRRMDWWALSLTLVPAGLAAFMIYLGHTVNDPLAFSHHQEGWQKIFTWRLWAGFLETIRQIALVQPRASFFEAHNVLNGALGALSLVASVLAARRLPAAYGLFLLAFWVVTLSSPAMAGGYPVPLVSLSRYVLTLFPLFIYLGILGTRRTINDSYLVPATALLSLLTVQFIHGGWVV
ncbi:MAG TPA: mannosyltransferase family protein [Chloroflexota bacterium]